LSDEQKALLALAKPFLDQLPHVYVARCCNRLYAGKDPPQTCRVCRRVPTALKVESLDQVRIEQLPSKSTSPPLDNR